jgi:hypothetical protein
MRSVTHVVTAVALLCFGPAALAKKPTKTAPAPEAKKASQSGTSGTQGGTAKEKSYTFSGLDIDGKLKTPQLLYFLNRMKSEFDTTTPEKRSFLPELKRSTDEM